MAAGSDRRAAMMGAIGAAGLAVLGAGARAETGSMASGFDIVDSQVHIGREGVKQALATMDALGIASVLTYEHWGFDPKRDPRHGMPGFVLPNGAWRGVTAVSAEASLAWPDRFQAIVKADRRDPQLRQVLEVVRSTPFIRAIRVLPVWNAEDAAEFVAGKCDRLFAIVQELGLPMFLFIPGFAAELRRYAAKYPRATVIVDHCGMPFSNIASPGSGKGAAYFDEVLRLADYPNVALKWSHANLVFGPGDLSHAAVAPYLRRAIGAFGAERVLWASDNTVIPGHSWADLLGAVRDSVELSEAEKRWLLGGAARKVLGWEASPAG